MKIRYPILIICFTALSAFGEGLPEKQSLVYTNFNYVANTQEAIQAHSAALTEELNVVGNLLETTFPIEGEHRFYFSDDPFNSKKNTVLGDQLRARVDKIKSYLKPDLNQINTLNSKLLDALIRQKSCRRKCRPIATEVDELLRKKNQYMELAKHQKTAVELELKLLRLHLKYLQKIVSQPGMGQRTAVSDETQYARRSLEVKLPHWALQLERQREEQKLALAEAARNRKLLLTSIDSACDARSSRLEFAETYEKQAKDVQAEATLLKKQLDENELITAWTTKIDELIAADNSGGNVATTFDDFHLKLTQLLTRKSTLKNTYEQTFEQKSRALEDATNSLRKSRSAVPVTTLDTEIDPCTANALNPADNLALAQFSAAEAAVTREENRVALHKQEAVVAKTKWETARQQSQALRSLIRRVLPHLSPEYDKTVFSYNTQFYEQLISNLMQLGTDVVEHTRLRLNQIRGLPAKAASWAGLMMMVSALFWLFLIMMIGRLAFRQADGWILGFHEWSKSIRTSQPVIRMMHSLTKLVSVIAPPGLIWITWWFTADYLGFEQPEVWTAYTVVMWVLLYQCLRQVSRVLFTGPQWSPERATTLSPALDRAPVFKLQSDTAIKSERSLHLITVYILLRVAVLSTVEALLGQNYLYHLAVDVVATAKWAVIVALVFWWRERVVQAYVGSDFSLFSDRFERHKSKIWMTLIVPLLIVAIVAKRTVPWLQDTFSKTGAMGAVFTFLSRRRMEQAVRQREQRADSTTDNLPNDYLKQFELSELTNETFLLTPYSRLQEISALYEFWAREKREGSLAIVGENGIGKSTLINLALARLPVDPSDVLRAKLERKLSTEREVIEFLAQTFGFKEIPETLHELEQAILNDKKPVVVIDDAHHFFLKKMGGMEALDAFVHVVTVTCTNVFWITAFNAYSWFFIKNLNRSEPPFRHIMTLRSWRSDEIEGLIMSRNAATEYETNFQDLVVDRGDGDNAQYEVVKTKRSYFRLLADLSGGNPSVALRYWLHSLRPSQKDKLLRVGLYNPAPPKALIDASEDILFALTCIAEHASLSPDELAAVLRMSPGAIHRMLSYCEEHNLITRSNGTVMLDLSNYDQITRALAIRSFIYFHQEQTVSS